MPHRSLLVTLVMLAPLAATAAVGDMLPGNGTHGRQLAQSKCVSCHVGMVGGDGSAIYTRKDRTVHTVEGLMARVAACNQRVGANFSQQDVDDVVKYLNQAYYKFKE